MQAPLLVAAGLDFWFISEVVVGIYIQCKHCGRRWEYRGSAKRGMAITCPRCLGKTPMNPVEESGPKVFAAYFNVSEPPTEPVNSQLAQKVVPPVVTTTQPIRSRTPDLNALLEAITKIRPGFEEATAYEKLIEPLITALFATSLRDSEIRTPINEGRKIIDITYTNVATEGFFQWLRDNNYNAPFIFVECKNYNSDLSNPEIDQLIGRFSDKRGRVGFLICRKVSSKEVLIKRCQDAAKTGQGYIIPLDDDDLSQLVNEAKNSPTTSSGLLYTKFKSLVM